MSIVVMPSNLDHNKKAKGLDHNKKERGGGGGKNVHTVWFQEKLEKPQ